MTALDRHGKKGSMKFSRLVLVLILAALTPWLLAGCGDDDDGDETTPAATSATGGDGAETTAADAKSVKLGALFATEGAGEPFGPQQVRGAQLAVDEINADGGIDDGVGLELLQRDGDGDPAQTVKSANDLIDSDEVHAILGATFSNTSADVHPLADELGVPMLAVSNTSTGIVGDCAYPCDLVFRNSLGEAAAIPANVESYAKSAGLGKNTAPGTAVVIHPDDDPFGETSAGIAQQAFAEAGLAETPVVHGAEAVDRAVRMKPQVVMITASSGEIGAEMVKALRKGGYKGDILGGNAFNSALTGELAGKGGKGVRVAAAWFAGNPSEENREFVAAYKAATGAEPDQFAAQAYAGVQLLAEAADDADLSFTDLEADRRALADALAGVDEETPLGELSFTADHDISQPIWIVEMDGKGGFKLVEEVPAA